MSDLSDDLDSIYKNIILLTYRSKCQFKQFGKCRGGKTIIRLIPECDIDFRWNPNNGVVVCRHHERVWESDPEMRFKMYESLVEQRQGLSEYSKPSRPLSSRLEALKDFLVANHTDIIHQKIPPFPFYAD